MATSEARSHNIEFRYEPNGVFLTSALLTGEEVLKMRKLLAGLTAKGHIADASVYEAIPVRQRFDHARQEITNALMLSDEEISEAESDG